MWSSSRLLTLALAAVLAAAAAAAADTQLVIYTYNYILQTTDPTYDFVSIFADTVGVDPSVISVQYFDDANGILTAAENVPSGMPAPDVLFGLDNVLQLDTAASLLQNYSSPGLSLLRPDIATALNLNNEPPLTPFDFGYIALTANMDALANYTFEYGVVTSANFSLADFVVHSSLFPLLVIENPLTSGTGINFLMWTIAVFGDSQLNLPGLSKSGLDWRDFWTGARRFGATIVPTWEEAFYDQFVGNNFPLVVSYATDSAYPVCFNESISYSIFGSNDDGTTRAWQNIEATGIMRSVRNLTLARQFVDWTLSTDFQTAIPNANFMFPADANIPLPSCFDITYSSGLSSVNFNLNAPTIQAHINDWVAELELILFPPTPTPTASATPTHSAASASVVASWIGLVAAVAIAAITVF